jgi:hypothetical protein
MKTAERTRSRNGHRSAAKKAFERTPDLLKGALGAIGAPLLLKLAMRKSVLIAIGLGTVASWVVKRMLAARRPRRRFSLFN